MNGGIPPEYKIILYNHFIKKIEEEEKPEVIIIGIPGEIMPISKVQPGHFGIHAFQILNAVNPDFLIMSLYGNEISGKYVKELKQIMKYKFVANIDCFYLGNYAQDVFTVNRSRPIEYFLINEKDKIRKMDGAPESRIKLSKLIEKYGNEDIAFQEMIRPIHGIRAQKYIYEMEESLFQILDCPVEQMKRTIANISRAHCENFQWMYEDNLSEKINIGDYELNEKYVAIILRLADYLDFDYRRANKNIFEKLELTKLSEEEWKKNQSIFNNRKVTKERKIELHGSCDNPIIYSKLLQYISDVEKEIDDAKNMSDKFDKYHRISIDGKISNRIKTIGFEGRDLKLSLDFKAIVSLLMGENIYGDKKYGLRELLQNSIDACKVMQEIYCIEERYSYETYKPQIRLIFDKNNDNVILKDNGIGMNLEVITRYFLNVGVSFYSSDEYVLAAREYSPIGHYGIGFLSCFMLSDHVKIVTKHWDEMEEREMEIGRGCEYVRLKANKDARMKHGTEIFLNYTEVMENFDDISQIINFIDENFIDCGVLIELLNLEEKSKPIKKCLLKKLEVSKKFNICLSEYLNYI